MSPVEALSTGYLLFIRPDQWTVITEAIIRGVAGPTCVSDSILNTSSGTPRKGALMLGISWLLHPSYDLTRVIPFFVLFGKPQKDFYPSINCQQHLWVPEEFCLEQLAYISKCVCGGMVVMSSNELGSNELM